MHELKWKDVFSLFIYIFFFISFFRNIYFFLLALLLYAIRTITCAIIRCSHVLWTVDVLAHRTGRMQQWRRVCDPCCGKPPVSPLDLSLSQTSPFMAHKVSFPGLNALETSDLTLCLWFIMGVSGADVRTFPSGSWFTEGKVRESVRTNCFTNLNHFWRTHIFSENSTHSFVNKLWKHKQLTSLSYPRPLILF